MKRMAIVALLALASSASGEEYEDVFDRVRPSIVTLIAKGDKGDILGTGFIVRENGLLVTAQHVVRSASSIVARFSDGRTVAIQAVVEEDSRRRSSRRDWRGGPVRRVFASPVQHANPRGAQGAA